MKAALAVGLAGLAVAPTFAQAPARGGALVGTVVASESGQPLAYSVIVLPTLDRELFTNDSGAFRLAALPPGPLLIRVRRLGYAPTEVTFPIRGGATDTLRVQLNRVAIRLAAVAVREYPPCLQPGPPDATRDSMLATVFDQLRLNAQQFQTLSRQYPFVYVMDITYSMTSLNDEKRAYAEAYDRFSSSRGWRYRPGKVVTRSRNSRSPTGLRFNIPQLPDFAEPAFIANHCFHGGGLVNGDDGRPWVRIDVVAAAKLKDPDVHGSMFLDPETFQIRKTVLRLSRVPNVRGMTDLEVITVFWEILPSIPVIQHAWSLQRFDPGVSGVNLVAAHEEQALAAFTFLGARPGLERKP